MPAAPSDIGHRESIGVRELNDEGEEDGCARRVDASAGYRNRGLRTRGDAGGGKRRDAGAC